MKYLVPAIVYFGFQYCFRLFYAFVPLHFNALGLTQAEIGMVMAVYPFSLIVLAVPIGMISDRFSPRTAAMLGLGLMSVSVWSLRWCGDFWSAFAAFAGVGTGVTLYTISAVSLYFKSLGDARRGVKLALFNSLSALGYGLGPMTGSLILSRNPGMPALFTAAALLAIPFMLIMRASPDAQVERVPLSAYFSDLKDRRAWFLLFTIFVFALHFGVENVCYSLFLRDNCGVPEARIGLVFLFVGLSIVPASFLTGLAADSARRSDGLMALGMALSGIFNAALYFVHSLWPVIALRVLHAIGDGVFLLYMDVAVSRLFPSQRVGAPIGLRDMVRMSGILCGSLLAGAMGSFDTPFLVVGVICTAMAPLVYRFFRTM